MAWKEIKDQKTTVELTNEEWVKLETVLIATEYDRKKMESEGQEYWKEANEVIDSIINVIQSRKMT